MFTVLMSAIMILAAGSGAQARAKNDVALGAIYALIFVCCLYFAVAINVA